MKKTIRPLSLQHWGVALTLGGALLFSSCGKNNPISNLLNEQEATVASAEADIAADMAFDDAYNNIVGVNDEVGMMGTGAFGRTAAAQRGCVKVTATSTDPNRTFPMVVELDFGTGCTDAKGITRKGKITTTYSARMTTKDAVANATFENFYVNDVKIEGNLKVEQRGSAGTGLIYKIDVTNGKVTLADGRNANWSSSSLLTQTDGNSTPFDPRDDAYRYSSTSSGNIVVNSDTFDWSKRTTTDLEKENSCRYIQKGVIELTRGSRNYSLNFGDGACDNVAVLTVRGIPVTITLR